MESYVFHDFDAFANSVGDIDAVMMLQNPTRRRWLINRVNLAGTHVQMGRLGSGNIVEGQSWSDGYVLYLPLTDTCEYSANGTVFDKNAFMVLEPGCEFWSVPGSSMIGAAFSYRSMRWPPMVTSWSRRLAPRN